MPKLLATTTLNTAVKPSTAYTNTLTQWHTDIHTHISWQQQLSCSSTVRLHIFFKTQ